MRPRKEIEADAKSGNPLDALRLEVLLDIRDLQLRARRPSMVLSEA
ncbi:MAG: hypothetical protein ABSF00_03575 [Candidatus Bathyarchaeia archaeon]|jgi:hypothetical protein